MRNWGSISVRSSATGSGPVGARQLDLGVLVRGLLEILLGEARREADGRRGLLTRLEIGRGDVHDAVRVDLERDLDLHLPAVADAEAGELELAEELAVLRPVR